MKIVDRIFNIVDGGRLNKCKYWSKVSEIVALVFGMMWVTKPSEYSDMGFGCFLIFSIVATLTYAYEKDK
jgi:hypothetical protein